MLETWKPIPGWEGAYEVSDHGRVRSLDRKVWNGRSERIERGRMMSRHSNHLGYWYSMLSSGGKASRVWISRSVLEAFCRPREDGEVAMHLNNDTSDNRLENLRWGTQKENIQQSVREGRNANLKKTHCPRGHLLERPNLQPSMEKKGKRSCLACSRAASYLYHHPESKHRMQAFSDAYYAKILEA